MCTDAGARVESYLCPWDGNGPARAREVEMSDTEIQDPIKGKHRAMWALGDYDAVATEVIPELGRVVAKAAGITPGARVLDVAAGSGNASLPAAAAGARVVASDLTPELLETGRRRAAEQGLDIEWVEADAECLPFEDQHFDAVISCVGVMFAPFHQPVADELLRVARVGGVIALANWTPDGFIGQMFAIMKPYAAPPPAGAQPGPLWGTEDHVRELFGWRVTDILAKRQSLSVETFNSAEAFRDYFKKHYGPTIAAYRNIADDSTRTATLDRELVDLARRHGADHGVMQWDYLLVTGRRST
ncbi:MAG: class I SAM-dependent methyltransferase [Pseudonocardiales bacterium]